MRKTLVWTPDQDFRARRKKEDQKQKSDQKPPKKQKEAPSAKKQKQTPDTRVQKQVSSPKTQKQLETQKSAQVRKVATEATEKPTRKLETETGEKTPSAVPSQVAKKRERWQKQNRLNRQELTIADRYLIKQIREKIPMVFQGYNITYRTNVKRLWRYLLDFADDSKYQRVSKLRLVYYYKQRDAEKIEKQIQMDETIAQQKLEPLRESEERFQLNDEVLKTYIKEHKLLEIKFRTGHIITGKAIWLTPYDIGLMLRGRVKVMVFRHAIYAVQVLATPKPKEPEEKINLNTATLEQITALDNIGAALAERMIANRPYAQVDDLLLIKGFGRKKLEAIEAKATV